MKPAIAEMVSSFEEFFKNIPAFTRPKRFPDRYELETGIATVNDYNGVIFGCQ